MTPLGIRSNLEVTFIVKPGRQNSDETKPFVLDAATTPFDNLRPANWPQ